MNAKQRTVSELRRIAQDDGRYHVDGLLFVLQGLEFLVSRLDERRHVSGQELSEGMREFAQTCYGLLARPVLAHWGIDKTGDFGHIVYLLIDKGWMNRTDDDRLEDFFDIYDFEEAFDSNYAIPHAELPKPSRNWLTWKVKKKNKA